jgi:hypothetical protein
MGFVKRIRVGSKEKADAKTSYRNIPCQNRNQRCRCIVLIVTFLLMTRIRHCSVTLSTALPILAALFTVLLLTACAKKEQDPVSEAPPSQVNTGTAAPIAEASGATAIDTTSTEAKAAELTQAVRKYAAEKQRAPKSLEELVAAGYLPVAPAAPAGKKFAIDKNLQVYLADQ